VEPLYQFDANYVKKYGLVAGVDEAGRGPIAGPLVVAACILDHQTPITFLNDSKQLTEKKREAIFELIKNNAVEYSIVILGVEEIDSLNILGATLQGMRSALNQLKTEFGIALVDGNKLPSKLNCPAEPIVKGDALSASIAAASILAKVTRDRIMTELHEDFPYFNWKKNKGYPTKEHLKALERYGITEHHRRSFHPIKQELSQNTIAF